MAEAQQKQNWTIGRVIEWSAKDLAAKGVDSPRLAAELLLAEALGTERLGLYLRFDQPLRTGELAGYKEMLKRARNREPVARILGRREFWGLELRIGPEVLCPRPETELLVELALEALREKESSRVLDICTGSGAVALALASELPGAEVAATDISAPALDIARENSLALGLDSRISWLHGDLFAPVAAAGGFFDVITANPPYVTQGEWEALSPEVKDFDPALALLGGEDGLDLIRPILAGAPAHLRAGSTLLIEIGYKQGRAALDIARKTGAYEKVHLAKDLAGVERTLVCERGDYG